MEYTVGADGERRPNGAAIAGGRAEIPKRFGFPSSAAFMDGVNGTAIVFASLRHGAKQLALPVPDDAAARIPARLPSVQIRQGRFCPASLPLGGGDTSNTVPPFLAPPVPVTS
jgi:hypothetical protein